MIHTIKILIATIFLLLLSAISYGQEFVSCQGKITELAAAHSSFHGFNAVGAINEVFWVRLQSDVCTQITDTGNNYPIEGIVYVVVNDIQNIANRYKYWIPILMSAKATGKKIKLHASTLEVTELGKKVVFPYFLSEVE